MATGSGSLLTPAPPSVWAHRLVPAGAVAATLLVIAGTVSFPLRGDGIGELYDAWVLHNAAVGLVGSVTLVPVLRKHPHNRAAWMLYVSALISAVHVALMGLVHVRLDTHVGLETAMRTGAVAFEDVPGDVMWPLWVTTWTWLLAAGLFLVIGLLLFPDGRLPSPRWRPVLVAGVTGLVIAACGYAWGNRPWSGHQVEPDAWPPSDAAATTLVMIGMVLLGAVGLAAAASLVVRLRSAAEDERRRVRPVLVVGALGAVVYVVLWPWQDVWRLLGLVVLWAFLGAVVLAMARWRLFDVEVLVSRAVVVATLAAFVTVGYVAAVAVVGRLAGNRFDLWVSVGVTAVIAVTFEPLRRRATGWADRLVSGKQATPYEVLSGLSDRLSRADSTDEVLERVVALLADGTGAARAEVWIDVDGQPRLAAAGPSSAEVVDDDVPVVRTVQVVHSGERLGEIRLRARREDHVGDGDERLLADVASSLGLVLRNARLTGELKQRIADLRASHRRLVTAQDDARRKLERDIHDGAQQELLSLRIRIGLVAALAERGGSRPSASDLHELGEAADRAIRSLRDLARGLYPPVLAEEGLAAAIRAQARSVPLPVTVHARGLGRYAREVEAAVYFCCLEALQNAAKHAGAGSVHVELSAADGRVRFTVADDGDGFEPRGNGHGTGLANMRDRLAGLGGDLEVVSTPGTGTVVKGEVPVDLAAPALAAAGQPPVSDR